MDNLSINMKRNQNTRSYQRNYSLNKNWNKRRKRNRWKKLLSVFAIFAVIGLGIAGVFLYFENQQRIAPYEAEKYKTSVFCMGLAVDELCVSNENIAYKNFQTTDEFHAIAVYDTVQYEVLCAENIHEKLYPASTTKILTAYLALKYGDLKDIVTVSANAVSVPADSSKAWLKVGDQLTLEALLYGLMLPSGNDAAVAVAEHISGSEEEFAKLMNEEAIKLGATNSNFVTAHGYQDEEHYTTAYDLYLIFNECIKNESFTKIVSSYAYETKITQANGSIRDVLWRQTNQYVIGVQEEPEGIEVVGGKTGTTDEAGACLIQLVKGQDNRQYITMIMGAETRPVLYRNMTKLLTAVNSEI